MRGGRQANQRKFADGAVGGHRQCGAIHRCGGSALHHRPHSSAAVCVEQVMGRENLCIGVVGRAARAAQATTGRQHPGVGQQQGHAVVVARHRHGRQDGEGFRGRVPQLWRQHRGVVRERHRKTLPPHHQHLPVGQHHAVVKCAAVGHGRQLAHLHTRSNVNGVAARGGIHVLIGGRPTHFQHLANVVHHGIATHAGHVVTPQTRCARAAGASGFNPVHVDTGPRVKHLAVAGWNQPHVVV